jgi:hypothetical protein
MSRHPRRLWISIFHMMVSQSAWLCSRHNPHSMWPGFMHQSQPPPQMRWSCYSISNGGCLLYLLEYYIQFSLRSHSLHYYLLLLLFFLLYELGCRLNLFWNIIYSSVFIPIHYHYGSLVLTKELSLIRALWGSCEPIIWGNIFLIVGYLLCKHALNS